MIKVVSNIIKHIIGKKEKVFPLFRKGGLTTKASLFHASNIHEDISRRKTEKTVISMKQFFSYFNPLKFLASRKNKWTISKHFSAILSLCNKLRILQDACDEEILNYMEIGTQFRTLMNGGGKPSVERKLG